MGKHFGNLQRLYGVTYYSLSPNELKPFHGILIPGFFQMLRRYRDKVLILGFVSSIFLSAATMVTDSYKKSMRKDPLKYACDK